MSRHQPDVGIEIELGDETFDAAVEVRGAPERVRALLDADTRANLGDRIRERPANRPAATTRPGTPTMSQVCSTSHPMRTVNAETTTTKNTRTNRDPRATAVRAPT